MIRREESGSMTSDLLNADAVAGDELTSPELVSSLNIMSWLLFQLTRAWQKQRTALPNWSEVRPAVMSTLMPLTVMVVIGWCGSLCPHY